MRELGEFDDLVEAPPYVDLAHPENLPVEPDVFPRRQLRMHTRPHLDQSPDAASNPNPPGRGIGDPRDQLERCRLPRPVRPDDRERLSLLHLERHVIERELPLRLGAVAGEQPPHTPEAMTEIVTQRPVAWPPAAVPLRHPLELHRPAHQITSAKFGSIALNRR